MREPFAESSPEKLSNLAAILGQRFRSARTSARKSQEELAAASGVSVRAISDLERGITRAPHESSVAMLADALGIQESERLEMLAIVRGLRRPAVAPVLPPEDSDPMLGREQVLSRLQRDFLDGVRLITLVGIGGIGKSRMAREVGRRVDAAGDRIVAWAPLAAVTDPLDVAAAISQAYGLPDVPGPLVNALAPALGGRSTLLVIDNFEHVIDAASVVAELLRGCPGLSVLATSREALRIEGEQTVVMEPLQVPALDAAATELAANAAVELFMRREAAVTGRSEDGPAGVNDAARIVRLLDGLPLAIELAAAQAATLSPAAIATLLEQSGLTALAYGRRDGPARFRTMEAAIAWTTDLLPPASTRLLGVVGVFRGGVTVEAAAGVAALLDEPALIGELPHLANVHLVQRQPGVQDRYSILEPVRMFALARLRASGTEREVTGAHAAWFLRWASLTAEEITGPELDGALRALDAIDMELPNLLAAVRTATQQGGNLLDAALSAALATRRFWEQRSRYRDGFNVFDSVVSAIGPDGTPGPDLRQAIFMAGYYANLLGDEPNVRRYSAEIRARAPREGSDEWEVYALILDALDAWRHADRLDEAERFCRSAWSLVSSDPMDFARWQLATFYGAILQLQGNAAAALPLLLEAAETPVALDCPIDQTVQFGWLGFALLSLGRIDEARARFAVAAHVSGRLRMPIPTAFALLGLARADILSERPDRFARAARFLGYFKSEIDRLDIDFGDALGEVVEDSDRRLSEVFAETRLSALFIEGGSSTLDEILALARD